MNLKSARRATDKPTMDLCSPVPPRLSEALPDLAAWTAFFLRAPLPVLADTAQRLEQLREVEDDVDAHLIAEAVGHDPLMTLKLLAHVAGVRHARSNADPETVTSALVLLGIGPFFRAFGPQTSVGAQLAGVPHALAGFDAVLRRAHRAAAFALAFAVHRMDPDAAILHVAALLHDFAELLVWLEAPTLMLRIQERQRADPALRSADVQREVLNTTLAELQHALMARWRMPRLLVQIDDDTALVETLQMRIVRLAIRVARHSTHGWRDAALPDDLHELGELLQLSEPHVLKLLHEIDADD